MENRPRHGEPAAATVAVCAPDPQARGRIEATLVLAGHDVVASCASVDELVHLDSSVPPAVIVLASAVEPFTRVRDVGVLRTELPGTPLVVVATGFFTRVARRLISDDVDGLLHETDIENALPATVDAVLANQLCLPSELRDALAQPVFSHREKQVLDLVLAGLTNGQIASRLYLSESTVKSHLASSFRKLGVSSRSEAARRLREPLLGLDLGLSGAVGSGVATAGVSPVA